jgi:dienelactone hydrolase
MFHARVLSAAALAALLAAALPNRVAGFDDSEIPSFARAPAYALAKLSPDGGFISYVEQSGAQQSLLIRSIAAAAKRALTVESARERFRWCGWADTNYVLCGTVAPVREPTFVSERTRLYAIDAKSGSVRELNARLDDPIRDQVIDLMPGRPGRVLLQHDSTGHGYPEVGELDVATGGLRRIVRAHPPVRRWMSDGAGEVRLGIGYDAGMAALLFRRNGSEHWTTYQKRALTDSDAVGPLAFGRRSSQLYALKHHYGRTALFQAELEGSAAPELLFADPRYDVSGPVLVHPSTRALLGVRYLAQTEVTQYFDAAEAALQSWLDEQLPNVVNVTIEMTLDARLRLVHSASDVNPPSLYLFDTQARGLSLLAHQYPELEGRNLAAMQATSYRARDGQTIPAYLTMPAGERRSGLPAIVLPHGGPEARNWKTFDALVQFLAAQGYIVLQPNFRGSFGYGAQFAAAGAGQWGGVIHNDITDGARWLIEQGIADPTRMCIVGSSFGGYAALLGAARESQWYACAASYAGASDLLAYSQYTDRLADADIWQQRLGTDARGLWQMSPLARVHAVETPILLMHGRSDPVVPISQARRLARALHKAGKPHRYIERGDCDHELTVQTCRMTFFTELQAFLGKHIPAR